MDIEALKREIVKHWVDLAEDPAYNAHVRMMVTEFTHDYPETFGDLAELMNAEKAKRKETKQ